MILTLIALTCSSPVIHLYQEKSFVNWMKKTNQLFIGEEYQIRLGIWLTNQRLVQEHNSGKTTFRVSMNKLSALTSSEYQCLLGYKGQIKRKSSKKSFLVPTDAEVDWRTKGVVNPIQDQGQCGSCWAFSATQSIESIYAIKTGTLIKLSEQNIVDCVVSCAGCEGGSMDYAFEYLKRFQKGYQEYLSNYPYTAVDGRCAYSQSKSVQVLNDYHDVSQGDEVALAVDVQKHGPIAVGIDASNWGFQLYTRGIYDDPNCNPRNVDHGVGLIGYGSENGVNYWIVRNSWTRSWGEEGYIRMVKDKNDQCGIATVASYPTAV